MGWRLVMGLWAVWMVGCGAAAAPSRSSAGPGRGSVAMADRDYAAPFDDSEALAEAAPSAQPLAQVDGGATATTGAPGPGQAAGNGSTGNGSATDATPGAAPLLIYEANVSLAVHEVEATQAAIVTVVREAGGYVQFQSTQQLVLRVPARRFHEALELVEARGDVLSRQVQATDVGEQFRDLTIRLRNAEAMRTRLEELLRRADDVEAALRVERELERITLAIEQFKGQLRNLGERIAYSTIRVSFVAHDQEPLGQPEIFQLPFQWLDELGLSSLLDLRR